MGTIRRQYPEEFKREALELLVSSDRPLSQIAGELEIPAARLWAWRNRNSGSQAGLPQRPNTRVAIPPAVFSPACSQMLETAERWRRLGYPM